MFTVISIVCKSNFGKTTLLFINKTLPGIVSASNYVGDVRNLRISLRRGPD